MSDKYDLNVIWQSPDGTWNRAFFDWDDPQGSREYDDGAFRWVSTGHDTQEEALDSWDGFKDGDWRVVSDPDDVARFEDLAGEAYLEASGRVPVRTMQYPTYDGPAKPRDPERLARDLAEARVALADYRDRGYSNLPDPRIAGWESALDELTAFDAGARVRVHGVFTEIAARFEQESPEASISISNGVVGFRKTVERPHAAAVIASLRSRYSPEAPAATSEGGSVRRKTTAASTAGSFAPKQQSRPGVTL